MLTDSRAKKRAVDANIAEGIARVLSARIQPDGCLINVRINMIISDLLQIQDLQERVNEAAVVKGWKIPAPSSFDRKKKQEDQFVSRQVESPSSGNKAKQLGALSSKKEVSRSMKTHSSLIAQDTGDEAVMAEIEVE